MNYFESPFGRFAPHLDSDAAIKFALNLALKDRRLKELVELMRDGADLGGIEGEPGWIIERRDAVDEFNSSDYPDWPMGARFCAQVDPHAYHLKSPIFYMSRAVFVGYLRQGLDFYVDKNIILKGDPVVAILYRQLNEED